jgi:hypothetical protein
VVHRVEVGNLLRDRAAPGCQLLAAALGLAGDEGLLGVLELLAGVVAQAELHRLAAEIGDMAGVAGGVLGRQESEQRRCAGRERLLKLLQIVVI